MRIFCENPIQEISSYLTFLSSEENCRKLLSGEVKSNRELYYESEEVLTLKSKQISFCVNQGMEYFKSFRLTNIITNPLPLYYGILSYSKAVLIANNSDCYLDQIKYHGLSSRPINEKTRQIKETDTSISKQFAIVNEGVFKLLINSVAHLSIPNKSIFYLENCLSIIPEIKFFYENYYNKSSKFINIDIISNDPANHFYFGIKSRDEKILLKVKETFPQLSNDFDLKISRFGTSGGVISGIYCSSSPKKGIPRYLKSHIGYPGGKLIYGDIDYELENGVKSICLDMIVIDFIITFILCDCTRYRPEIWYTITSGENSSIRPLIAKYLESVNRRFPNEILNLLYGEKYIFTTYHY